jgi:dTDP-D-glucose 4,6-dehydratase
MSLQLNPIVISVITVSKTGYSSHMCFSCLEELVYALDEYEFINTADNIHLVVSGLMRSYHKSWESKYNNKDIIKFVEGLMQERAEQVVAYMKSSKYVKNRESKDKEGA